MATIPIGDTVYSWLNLPEILIIEGTVLKHCDMGGVPAYLCKFYDSHSDQWFEEVQVDPSPTKELAMWWAEKMDELFKNG